MYEHTITRISSFWSVCCVLEQKTSNSTTLRSTLGGGHCTKNPQTPHSFKACTAGETCHQSRHCGDHGGAQTYSRDAGRDGLDQQPDHATNGEGGRLHDGNFGGQINFKLP